MNHRANDDRWARMTQRIKEGPRRRRTLSDSACVHNHARDTTSAVRFTILDRTRERGKQRKTTTALWNKMALLENKQIERGR